MSRKHVPFALFFALTIAGCASPTSHATSPGMFGDVDLSSGGRWYLIDLDGDRASVLDGIDAIRAARDRITFKPDPPGAGIVAHGPVGALHLVHDGRIVWSAQAFRPGDISLGTTSADFVPLTSCPVTLRRRDEDRYLQSFRAGQIFIDGLPDLPFDAYFDVTLPAYAVQNGPEAAALSASVERRIPIELRRLFPRDSFDVNVTESTIFPIPYVDAAGKAIPATTASHAGVAAWKIYTPHLQFRASNADFYRRVLARRRELDTITGQRNVPTTLAPTFAILARLDPSAPRPIRINEDLSPATATDIGTLDPLSTDDTYYVKTPPCPFDSETP